MCPPTPMPDLPPRPGKLVAVGKNYRAHVQAMGDGPVPTAPLFFLKPTTALAIAPTNLWLPPDCETLHPEAELVLVVGRQARDLEVEGALDCLAGVAAGLDMTDRSWQAEAKRRGWPWEWAKGFDGAAGLGEVIPLDQAGPLEGLRIELAVDGRIVQRVDPNLMLRDPAELLAACSRRFTLEPGDLVFTGAPAGTEEVGEGAQLELQLGTGTARLATARFEISRTRPEPW